MKSRHARGFLGALACGASLLGVSACGSSSPKQVSPAVTSKLVSELEKVPLTAAKANEVVDCLVPTLQKHGVTTLAAANAYGNNTPSWLQPATVACMKQAGLTGG